MSSQNAVSPSPQAIMEMPWPKREEHLFLSGMQDLPPEEMDRLRSEDRFSREEEARLQQGILNAKRQVVAVCPIFSVSLASQNTIATYGKLHIITKLRYDGNPNGEALAVILQNPRANFQDSAVRYGGYHIFSDSSCDPSFRLPFNKIYVTMRRARGPDGRFLPEPAEDPVSEDSGWAGMGAGDEAVYEYVIDLCSNRGWKDSLRAGNDYWLKYGVPGGMSVGRAELANWRFGTMEDWKGKLASQRRSTYVAIRLGPSNALKFHVDSM